MKERKIQGRRERGGGGGMTFLGGGGENSTIFLDSFQVFSALSARDNVKIQKLEY